MNCKILLGVFITFKLFNLVKRCPRYGLPKFEGSLPYKEWVLSNVTHINAHTITKTCPTSML
jgi:hypothetical protein